MEIRVCSYNAILSIDGKIAMECYGRVFDFFSRCIAAHLQHAHADGVYRVLGSYAFDMCLFMTYLQHNCDTI